MEPSGAKDHGSTGKETALYQQIHPGEFATDWAATSFVAVLLWQHELLPGLAVAIVPAVAATALVMSFADLGKAGVSLFGRYVRFQILWAMALGVIVISLGWLRGILIHAPTNRSCLSSSLLYPGSEMGSSWRVQYARGKAEKSKK